MLAQSYELKPRGGQKNGTPIGGCITLLISAFILVYVISQYYQKYTGKFNI